MNSGYFDFCSKPFTLINVIFRSLGVQFGRFRVLSYLIFCDRVLQFIIFLSWTKHLLYTESTLVLFLQLVFFQSINYCHAEFRGLHRLLEIYLFLRLVVWIPVGFRCSRFFAGGLVFWMALC